MNKTNKKIVEIDDEIVEAINELNITTDMEYINYEDNIEKIDENIDKYKSTFAKKLIIQKPDIIKEIIIKEQEENKIKKTLLYKIKKLLNLI
jgi:hypothetical protein